MNGKLHILVVDDDRDLADSLAELLELEGHRVRTVYSGPEAVEAYRECDFDLAFMDVMMPGKNGVESFFEIRRTTPTAQVYMMTAYSVEQLVQQALDNGALGIMQKPLDLDRLLGMVGDLSSEGIVLVAEDDEALGSEMLHVMRSAGLRAELVRDGRAALKAARERSVKALVLDVGLPLISGIEVCASLSREGPAIPTIIVTGIAPDCLNQMGFADAVRATGILRKPFDPVLLLEQIQDLARER